MKKRICISIDEDILTEFKEAIKDNGLSISSSVEILMENSDFLVKKIKDSVF